MGKTSDSALFALEEQIVRLGPNGLAAVEKLQPLPSVPLLRVRPTKRDGAVWMGEVRMIILAGLRERPICLVEVAELVEVREVRRLTDSGRPSALTEGR